MPLEIRNKSGAKGDGEGANHAPYPASHATSPRMVPQGWQRKRDRYSAQILNLKDQTKARRQRTLAKRCVNNIIGPNGMQTRL